MECQNQVHDLWSMKEWGGVDPAQLKQQHWGQCSFCKGPLILTAELGSLKLHKAHSFSK